MIPEERAAWESPEGLQPLAHLPQPRCNRGEVYATTSGTSSLQHKTFGKDEEIVKILARGIEGRLQEPL